MPGRSCGAARRSTGERVDGGDAEARFVLRLGEGELGADPRAWLFAEVSQQRIDIELEARVGHEAKRRGVQRRRVGLDPARAELVRYWTGSIDDVHPRLHGPVLVLAGGGLRGEHVPWLSRAGVRQFHVGSTVRPGGSWTKSYVDPAHVRSWRMLLDDAVEHAEVVRRAARGSAE